MAGDRLVSEVAPGVKELLIVGCGQSREQHAQVVSVRL
jgi:hypothetical protein